MFFIKWAFIRYSEKTQLFTTPNIHWLSSIVTRLGTLITFVLSDFDRKYFQTNRPTHWCSVIFHRWFCSTRCLFLVFLLFMMMKPPYFYMTTTKVIGGELQERLIPVPYSKSSTDQAVSNIPSRLSVLFSIFPD